MEAFEGSFDAAEQAVQLGAALKGVELVIIPAGVPRKPGMTRDDLFKINAGEGRPAACISTKPSEDSERLSDHS